MYLKRAKYVHYCDTFDCGLQDMCFKTFHTYKMTSRAFVFVFVFASNHRPYLEHGWLRKCVSGHFTRIRRLVIAVITLPPPAIGWSPPHILEELAPHILEKLHFMTLFSFLVAFFIS